MPSCNASLNLSGRDSLFHLHKNTFPLQDTKDSQGHYSHSCFSTGDSTDYFHTMLLVTMMQQDHANGSAEK